MNCFLLESRCKHIVRYETVVVRILFMNVHAHVMNMKLSLFSY